jgi:hypothetical protein
MKEISFFVCVTDGLKVSHAGPGKSALFRPIRRDRRPRGELAWKSLLTKSGFEADKPGAAVADFTGTQPRHGTL